LGQLVERYGADLPLLEWSTRLVCSACGSREVDFVVSGESRWEPGGALVIGEAGRPYFLFSPSLARNFVRHASSQPPRSLTG
jgi:hypothetical protein